MKRKPVTYPIAERHNLVHVSDFAFPPADFSIKPLMDAIPRIHAGESFARVVNAMVMAKKSGKVIMLGIGAHVIKCGLNPYLIKLMELGGISSLAMNGAGAIHDFELAAFGATSEDVAAELPKGRFGFAHETGEWIGLATRAGADAGIGFGQALYEYMIDNPERFPHRDTSLLWNAGKHGILCTIHVAIGTDFIHMHPQADGASIGAVTFTDFQNFCERVQSLEGGVYWNLGSAVILPEVFLKAVSLAHNLGFALKGLTTVNMDMQIQYRTATNVVKRPSIGTGAGYHLTGHHEIMVPLIVLSIIEGIRSECKYQD